MSENEGSVIFVANLRRLIEERDITQTELAEAIGVTQGMVSNWLRGTNYPRIQTMQKIANYFNIPVTSLTSRSSQNPDDILFNDMLKRLSDYDKQILLLTMQRLLDKPK